MNEHHLPAVNDSGLGRGLQGRSPVRVAAGLVGAVFLLVGVLGFVPGVTTHHDDLQWAGHHSGARLLGLFQVSALHNVVHLLFGAAGLALARSARGSVAYLVGGGLVYAVLWVYGLVVDPDSGANVVPLNDADNWLHLGLAVGMVGLGLALRPPSGPGTGPGTGPDSVPGTGPGQV